MRIKIIYISVQGKSIGNIQNYEALNGCIGLHSCGTVTFMVLGQFSDICRPSANIRKLAKDHKSYGSTAMDYIEIIWQKQEKNGDNWSSISNSFLRFSFHILSQKMKTEFLQCYIVSRTYNIHPWLYLYSLPMVLRVLWYRSIYFVCSYALQRHPPVFLFIYS
jgi:hypothetical protein